MKHSLSKFQDTLRRMLTRQVTGVAIVLVALGAIVRMFPHPPNIAPIAAVALFGGLYLPRRFALTVPVLAMLISDAVIGWYSLPVMVSVYVSFLAVGLIGLAVRTKKSFWTVAGGTLTGSVLFYLVTNFAVWAFGHMYPHTVSRLLESYYLALPFFRNTLIGNVAYVTALVGGFELASRWAASQSHVSSTVSSGTSTAH